MKYANLHLHTVYSDGVLTPAELCEKAKELGYGALSITDHYTVTGWKAFETAAKAAGMDYILGMEAVGSIDGKTPHIVAYDFDPTYPGMAAYCKAFEEDGYAVTKAKFEVMSATGKLGKVTWEDVLKNSPEECWFCNEQIFATLVKMGIFTQADYWYFRREFFLPAKVHLEKKAQRPTAREMIKLIRDAGGVASLAHPHDQTDLLPILADYGLNCVEYDHPDIDENDSRLAREFAESHPNFYLAGGTDHTGMLANHAAERGWEPNFVPGGYMAAPDEDVRCGVTEEEFLALKNRIKG